MLLGFVLIHILLLISSLGIMTDDVFYYEPSYRESKTPRTYSSLDYAGTDIDPEDIGKFAEGGWEQRQN